MRRRGQERDGEGDEGILSTNRWTRNNRRASGSNPASLAAEHVPLCCAWQHSTLPCPPWARDPQRAAVRHQRAAAARRGHRKAARHRRGSNPRPNGSLKTVAASRADSLAAAAAGGVGVATWMKSSPMRTVRSSGEWSRALKESERSAPRARSSPAAPPLKAGHPPPSQKSDVVLPAPRPAIRRRPSPAPLASAELACVLRRAESDWGEARRGAD